MTKELSYASPDLERDLVCRRLRWLAWAFAIVLTIGLASDADVSGWFAYWNAGRSRPDPVWFYVIGNAIQAAIVFVAAVLFPKPGRRSWVAGGLLIAAMLWTIAIQLLTVQSMSGLSFSRLHGWLDILAFIQPHATTLGLLAIACLTQRAWSDRRLITSIATVLLAWAATLVVSQIWSELLAGDSLRAILASRFSSSVSLAGGPWVDMMLVASIALMIAAFLPRPWRGRIAIVMSWVIFTRAGFAALHWPIQYLLDGDPVTINMVSFMILVPGSIGVLVVPLLWPLPASTSPLPPAGDSA